MKEETEDKSSGKSKFNIEYQELLLQIIALLNSNTLTLDLIRLILKKIHTFTEIEAVAIRLPEGEDFPYFCSFGFPAEFIKTEKCLCARDENGKTLRDSNGNVYLECMCGNVISRRTDSSRSYFTKHGSFHSNNTSRLFAEISDKERLAFSRNYCNKAGYESVALIPVKTREKIIGLLQFNDRRTNCFDTAFIEFFENLTRVIGFAYRGINLIDSLKSYEQNLLTSNQQLKASNQQLSNTEQELKASGQQLQAADQQLRANNQQLRASVM
ncbi:MAG: GAF domain-containing protein [Victivallales bacterium]|nr:GAF domain-containing protein [Victivallales bacterium]